jgi:hypothetical protein
MAVIFALALPTMLGAVALCTDVGVMYANWAELQKAADAAVLAGANRGLPYDAALATETAQQYAEMNGISKDEILSTTVASDNMALSMTLQRQVSYVFGRVLGLTSAPVTVSATAGLQPAQGACDFMPVGVPCNATATVSSVSQCGTGYTTFENGGSQATLKPFPTGTTSMQGPGNWEPLALGGPGGATYENNIIFGYQGPAIVPGSASATVSTQTGEVAGPTFNGFQQRLQNGGETSYTSTPPPDSSLDATNPQVVIVPLVNFGSPNGNSSVQIVGFQTMWISDVSGGTGTITGYFINPVPGCSSPATSGQTAIGEYSAVLTQ